MTIVNTHFTLLAAVILIALLTEMAEAKKYYGYSSYNNGNYRGYNSGITSIYELYIIGGLCLIAGSIFLYLKYCKKVNFNENHSHSSYSSHSSH